MENENQSPDPDETPTVEIKASADHWGQILGTDAHWVAAVKAGKKWDENMRVPRSEFEAALAEVKQLHVRGT